MGAGPNIAMPPIAPPEYLHAMKTGEVFVGGSELDVFHFGTLIWEIMTKKDAYAEAQRPNLSLSTLSKKFIELIESCWNDDLYRRPRITAVITRLESIKLEGPPRIDLTLQNAKKYQKKNTIIAYQSQDPITIVKAWGKSKGRANAYVVLGANNDVYCLDEEIFTHTYEPVINKPDHYRKIGSILALQMKQGFSVKTNTGTIEHGNEGDYLVQNEAHEQWPIEQSQFDALYEEVP